MFMVERSLSFIEADTTLEKFKLKVKRELNLKDVVPDIPTKVEKGIVKDVAGNLVKLCKLLNIPFPDIRSMSPSEVVFSIKSITGEERYALAGSAVSTENPNGVIKLSPIYLDHLISYRMGFNEDVPVPIEYLISHEAFHLYQHREMPERVKADCLMYSSGAEAWEQTITEIHATEFGKSWLEQTHRNF